LALLRKNGRGSKGWLGTWQTRRNFLLILTLAKHFPWYSFYVNKTHREVIDFWVKRKQSLDWFMGNHIQNLVTLFLIAMCHMHVRVKSVSSRNKLAKGNPLRRGKCWQHFTWKSTYILSKIPKSAYFDIYNFCFIRLKIF
jgi:hypothetical protein